MTCMKYEGGVALTPLPPLTACVPVTISNDLSEEESEEDGSEEEEAELCPALPANKLGRRL